MMMDQGAIEGAINGAIDGAGNNRRSDGYIMLLHGLLWS
jgi:hypothetical protein